MFVQFKYKLNKTISNKHSNCLLREPYTNNYFVVINILFYWLSRYFVVSKLKLIIILLSITHRTPVTKSKNANELKYLLKDYYVSGFHFYNLRFYNKVGNVNQ